MVRLTLLCRRIKWLKVDTVSMRFRATLTSFLTVILLSLSSVASACEIKCDLAKMGPSCHEARSTPGRMPKMAGMEQPQVSKDSAASASTAHHCQHQVCATQPALLVERNGVIAYATPSVAAVIPHFLLLAPAALDRSIPVRGPPPFRTDSPVSLHTTLRV